MATNFTKDPLVGAAIYEDGSGLMKIVGTAFTLECEFSDSEFVLEVSSLLAKLATDMRDVRDGSRTYEDVAPTYGQIR